MTSSVPGLLRENFTIEGLSDDEVRIGDRYRIGAAVFEVTQPRVTCYRVGIRMDDPRMPALLISHHRPGFYFRVLREGGVRPGDAIVKVAAGKHILTVTGLKRDKFDQTFTVNGETYLNVDFTPDK